MITEREKTVLIEMVKREVGGCEICGKQIKLVVHHLNRKTLGGKDFPRNLQIICSDCHKQVHYNEPGMRRK